MVPLHVLDQDDHAPHSAGVPANLQWRIHTACALGLASGLPGDRT